MVEKKEFAVLFRKIQLSETIEEFIPLQVIEGKYNHKLGCFEDDQKVKYHHIDFSVPENVVGYASRTTIEHVKDTISSEYIEKIKEEIFNNIKKFIYRRDFSNNDYIIVINQETRDEFIFEDLDNMPLTTKPKTDINKQENKKINMTPLKIEQEVKKTIKGQDAAIRTIATALWSTINNRKLTKKQMLLIGPTGVGKTAIFQKLQEVLDIPVIIFSVPGLSQAGYVGRSTDEILKQIYYECEKDIDKAENCIVILDEIDKIAFNKEKTNSDVSTGAVQNELLKMVEGYKRVVEIEGGIDHFDIDTSNIIFICTGAFQELFEKEKTGIGFTNYSSSNRKEINNITTERLVNYGLKRELIGRFPIQVKLNHLTKENLKEIVLDSDQSELLAHIQYLNSLGVIITNLNEIIDIIVDDALTKEIGARGLIETISNLFQEIIYEVANNPNKYNEVTIGKNILQDPYDFILTKKQTKKRVRKVN